MLARPFQMMWNNFARVCRSRHSSAIKRSIEHATQAAQLLLRRSLQEIKQRDGHGGQKQPTAGGGAHLSSLLVLLLRLHHRLLPRSLIVRRLPLMPLGEHPQPARVHAELAVVHGAAVVLHPQPQVLQARHGAAALHRHAHERLPRAGRRGLRPPERGAPPRAQRRPPLRATRILYRPAGRTTLDGRYRTSHICAEIRLLFGRLTNVDKITRSICQRGQCAFTQRSTQH